MKKTFAILLSATMVAGALTACGGSEDKGFDASKSISVMTREEGSGTRGAFVELTGVEEKDADGKKVDKTYIGAAVSNNTEGIITNVASNQYAIGYISLGSLKDTVKALKVEGVEATAENVANGSYKLARPFNIAVKDNLSDVAQDFINYILSEEGKTIIEEAGYVGVSEETYTSNGATGKITISGSTSVGPVMEKLKEAYEVVNTSVEIAINVNDSSTGVSDAAEGICDIGMASRELKTSETEKGVKGIVIAKDGIAVIVNKENTTEDITMAQIKSIYVGETTKWDALAK